jgi:hypothetical protein
MPWNQTEELFKSTLQAATGSPYSDDDAWSAPTPKHEAVDLGEAGSREIWEVGAARIEKLIAKHGGKPFPARYKDVYTSRPKSKTLACSWRASGLRDRFRRSSMSLAILRGAAKNTCSESLSFV